MTEIASNLLSPAWWFSAVVIALLINLISAYVKPPLDNILGRFSERRRMKNDAVNRKFIGAAEQLAASAEQLAFALEQELRARLQSILLLLFSIVFLVQAIILQSMTSDRSVFLFVVGMLLSSLVFIVASFFCWRGVMQMAPLARHARKIRIESEAACKRDA